MINEQILNSIIQDRKTGITDDQIRQTLLNTGWKIEDIQDAFNSFNSQSPAITSTLATTDKKHLKIITIFSILIILIVGYFGLTKINLLPNLGSLTNKIFGNLSNKNILEEKETVVSYEITKIETNSSVEKFYFAVIENGSLVYSEGQGSNTYPLPNLVTIYKYDIKEEKLSKVFGPYTSDSKYLQNDYTPRLATSENGKILTFSDNALFTFLGKSKEFKIITPHKDLDAENVESPVISPDGNKIAYSVGDEIKMFDKSTNEYKVLIQDTTVLSQAIQDYERSAVYPVFWYRKDNEDLLLIEVRSKNQNSIPLALTGFYIYDFRSKNYKQISFNYLPGKKIQPCGNHDWSCAQSPIVVNRSPNGQYEIINNNGSEFAVIDYSALTQNPYNIENATLPLPNCPAKYTEIIWSYDSKKLLCSGLDMSVNEQFTNLAINNLKNNKEFDFTYKYITIDIQSGSVLATKQEQLKVATPESIKGKILNQLQKIDEQLTKNGVNKESKEYIEYTNEVLWSLFLTLQSKAAEQIKKVVGWVGKDLYLAVQTKSDGRSGEPISHEVSLVDLNGTTKTLETYSIDPKNLIGGQNLIEKLESISVNQEAFSELKKKIQAGQNIFATMDKIYIKYLGSVLP